MLDMTILSFLAAPFVASLVIAGIHAYLGVHVVERGVIFVDLSLAQIAAFGATIAILLPMSGGDPHGPAVYWISLLFTFIGAAIFATIRSRRARIPQEAIIGISYAVASAATILAMSKSTSEGEHLKDMLVGNILAVSWEEVWHTAALYAVIGAFHFVFRKKFLAISLDPEAVERSGVSLRLWDFLFYMSFGVVISFSVEIAGVLMVLHALSDRYPVNEHAIRRGLQEFNLSGRFQVVPDRAQIILDVAHNRQSMELLVQNLRGLPVPGRTHVLIGMLSDKNHPAIFREIMEIADFWHLVTLEGPRGTDSGMLGRDLAALGVSTDRVAHYPVVADALNRIREMVGPQDRIVITGSFLTVGAAMKHLRLPR